MVLVITFILYLLNEMGNKTEGTMRSYFFKEVGRGSNA
jgi:hypothetical protein